MHIKQCKDVTGYLSVTQDCFSSCAPKHNERHFYLMIMDTRPNSYCWQLSNYEDMRCCSQQPEQNIEWLKADCAGRGHDLPHSSRKLLQLMESLWLTAIPSRWDSATSSEVEAEAQLLHCVSLCFQHCVQPSPSPPILLPFSHLAQLGELCSAGEVLFSQRVGLPRLSLLLAVLSNKELLSILCCLTLLFALSSVS